MKTVKKALTAFLAVFVIFAAFPVNAFADTDYTINNIYGVSHSDNGAEVFSNNIASGGTMRFSPAIAGRVEYFYVYAVFDISQAKQGDIITLEATLKSSQITNISGSVLMSQGELINSSITTFTDGKAKITGKVLQDIDPSQKIKLTMTITVNSFDVVDGKHDVDLAVSCRASAERVSETTGLLNSIIEFVKGIFEKIGELPDKIGNFFNDLKNNLSTWFANIGNWFTELGDKISGFFVDIGDKISGFFEKLWNRIYWGNENGESEYEPPTFGEQFTEFLQKLEDYVMQLQQVQGNISDSKDEAVSYLNQGTTLINSVMGVFPSVLTAFVSFGLAFIFCRKVVGR